MARERKEKSGGDGLIRITVMMDERHHERLRVAKAVDGKPYAEQVIDAVDTALKKNPKFRIGRPKSVRLAFQPELYRRLEKAVEKTKTQVINGDGEVEEKTIGFSSLIRYALDNTEPKFVVRETT